MSKLADRIFDPTKSGVYRASHDRDIRTALHGRAHDLAEVRLPRGKDAMLAEIAAALDFPDWFGANWDALEDCLTDLSWRPQGPHLFLFSDAVPGDELGILQDVLASAAESWGERGRCFFAVFIDPGGSLSLPALYRQKAA